MFCLRNCSDLACFSPFFWPQILTAIIKYSEDWGQRYFLFFVFREKGLGHIYNKVIGWQRVAWLV